VLLEQTRTVAAAARLIGEIPLESVRDRAAQLLAELRVG
jgi:hypothetical protein